MMHLRTALGNLIRLALLAVLAGQIWRLFGPMAAVAAIGVSAVLILVWQTMVRPWLSPAEDRAFQAIFLVSSGVAVLVLAMFSQLGVVKSLGVVAGGLIAAVVAWRYFMQGHMNCEQERRDGMEALHSADFEGAEKLLISSLERARNLPHRREGPLGVALYNLAYLYLVRKQHDKAQVFGREALQVLETPGNPMAKLLPRVYELMVGIQLGRSEFEAAEKVAERGLGFLTRRFGQKSAEVGQEQWLFGRILLEHGRYPVAVKHLQAALDVYHRIEGPEGANVADILLDLGTAHRKAGNYEEALETLKRGVELQEELHGPDSGDMAAFLHGLGLTYSESGFPHSAADCYQRAVELRQSASGPEDPQLGLILSNLADSLNKMERVSDAERIAKRAVKILEKAGDPKLYTAMEKLAEIKADRGQDVEADRLFHTALAMLQQSAGTDNLEVADYLDKHAAVVWKLGRMKEADEMMSRAEQIRRTATTVV